jgi:uncharacterized membrane protein AbrB (regulator of aidB expression)
MSHDWKLAWTIFIALFCLVPAWFAIGFFDRNYQVRPNVFLIWYFLGGALTSVFFGGSSLSAIMPSWKLVLAMLLIGLTVGGGANILLFRAVADAPNPGLPVAIGNGASVVVFLVAILLSRWAPSSSYFNPVEADPWSFLGVLLTVIGASIIAIRG